MSERDADWTERLGDRTVGRRGALKALTGGGLALGGAKAVDNVLLGYGVVMGTNLVEQDLAGLVGARFGPSQYSAAIGDVRIGYRNDRLSLRADSRAESLPVTPTAVDRAEALDGEFNLGGRFASLAADLVAVEAGDYRFEFATVGDFFDRVGAADQVRPETVGALRGSRFEPADRDVVSEFIGADAADVDAVVYGLASGFREHTNYDFARYAAGSVEDNLLFGAGDLRGPLRSPTSFEAILAGRNEGLFCYDFAYRSIEALHATPASEQTHPVAGVVVTDARHKHVYTGVATALRVDGELVVPVTFVDYMHATQYDDLHLRGVLGEGLNAYDDRHRTTDVYWNQYAIW